jgi:ankyrin repeat protein
MEDFIQQVSDKFPLHWLVWEDRPEALDKELESNANVIDKELIDPKGRTPLHLAVTLHRFECCKILLKHGANSNAENRCKNYLYLYFKLVSRIKV